MNSFRWIQHRPAILLLLCISCLPILILYSHPYTFNNPATPEEHFNVDLGYFLESEVADGTLSNEIAGAHFHYPTAWTGNGRLRVAYTSCSCSTMRINGRTIPPEGLEVENATAADISITADPSVSTGSKVYKGLLAFVRAGQSDEKPLTQAYAITAHVIPDFSVEPDALILSSHTGEDRLRQPAAITRATLTYRKSTQPSDIAPTIRTASSGHNPCIAGPAPVATQTFASSLGDLIRMQWDVACYPDDDFQSSEILITASLHKSTHSKTLRIRRQTQGVLVVPLVHFGSVRIGDTRTRRLLVSLPGLDMASMAEAQITGKDATCFSVASKVATIDKSAYWLTLDFAPRQVGALAADLRLEVGPPKTTCNVHLSGHATASY